jgi:hypothetical protein
MRDVVLPTRIKHRYARVGMHNLITGIGDTNVFFPVAYAEQNKSYGDKQG